MGKFAHLHANILATTMVS